MVYVWTLFDSDRDILDSYLMVSEIIITPCVGMRNTFEFFFTRIEYRNYKTCWDYNEATVAIPDTSNIVSL